jgi:integrase
MPTSVNLVLRTQKARADGTAPIYVRATANRKSRFIATGIHVRPKDWNDKKQEVRAGHDLAAAYNRKLGEVLNDAREAALDAPTATAVKAALTGTTGSMTAFFERHVARLEAAGQYWQGKHFAVTLNHVRAALGADVLWTEVDRDVIGRFERYLRVEQKNQPNTVRNHLKRLRRVYREALKEGVIRPNDDPFVLYTPPKPAAVHRRKLTLEQVRALAAAPAQEGSTAAVARDAFTFAFYAAGMRFSDVATVKTSDLKDGKRLEYRMMKTGTVVSVTLPPMAVKIAEAYAMTANERGDFLFPFLNPRDAQDGVTLRQAANRANARINAALQRLALKAEPPLEADGLSFHIARHSYADLARQSGGQLHDISKALGHTTLTVTQAYLASFDRNAADRLAGALWGKGDGNE